MAPRGLLVLLLLLATLTTLAVGGSTCDMYEEETLRSLECRAGAASKGWALRLRALNATSRGEEDGDGSLLPAPSFPELSLELAQRCSKCTTPGNNNDCVADLSASCNATSNYVCGSCSLWRNVHDCLASPSNPFCNGMFQTVYYPPAVPLVPSGSMPIETKWIAMPLEPVVGVENMARGDAGRSTADVWLSAWFDAVVGSSPRPLIPANELTVMIDSPAARRFHSLHLHVGRKSRAWAACVNYLPLQPEGVWWRATCKGLNSRGAVDETEVYYLWPVGGRLNILAAAQEGLELAGRSPTAGVALVAYPGQLDENLVVVFDGPSVSHDTLLQ